MTPGQILLYSLIEAGRWTVLIVFGVLALGFLVHLFRHEIGVGPAATRDSRSWPGAVATFVLALSIPVCVKLGWGSVRPWLPMTVAAALAGIGTLGCFIGLNLVGWAALVLGRAAHILARVDQGGKLVREAPFNIVRHPIYFGMGLLLAGSALAGLNWIVALVAIVWWPLAIHRACLEDRVLRAAFGAQFDEYARSVPAVWPKL
jgi:protein-S-isoprenylcysteine O-methyltransferase Ste14